MKDVRQEVLEGLLDLKLDVGVKLHIETFDGPIYNSQEFEAMDDRIVRTLSRPIQYRSVEYLIQLFANDIINDCNAFKRNGVVAEEYVLVLNQFPIPHNRNAIRYGKVIKIANLKELRKA